MPPRNTPAADLKTQIAEGVQRGLLASFAREARAALDVESVEVNVIGPRETQIRVKTAQGMPRYFLVKVSEQL